MRPHRLYQVGRSAHRRDADPSNRGGTPRRRPPLPRKTAGTRRWLEKLPRVSFSDSFFATVTDALSMPAQEANASAMPLHLFTLEIWANARDKKQFPTRRGIETCHACMRA